jgi:hypothetical protein
MVFCFMELLAKSDLSALLGLLQNASRARWKCQGAFVFSLIAALRRMRKQARLFFHLLRECVCVAWPAQKERARATLSLYHIFHIQSGGARCFGARLSSRKRYYFHIFHIMPRSLALSLFYFAYDTIAVMHFNVLYHSLLNTI